MRSATTRQCNRTTLTKDRCSATFLSDAAKIDDEISLYHSLSRVLGYLSGKGSESEHVSTLNPIILYAPSRPSFPQMLRIYTLHAFPACATNYSPFSHPRSLFDEHQTSVFGLDRARVINNFLNQRFQRMPMVESWLWLAVSHLRLETKSLFHKPLRGV